MSGFTVGQVILVGDGSYGAKKRCTVTDPSVDPRGRIAARDRDGMHIVPLESVCRPLESVRPGTNEWALIQLAADAKS